jgi:hypothetical protein
MRAGLLGCLTAPGGGSLPPAGVTWAADNGAFGKSYPGDDAWWAWLTDRVHRAGADLCLFAVAPDVVADAAATLERSLPWLPRIRALGVPAAFVAQDGAEDVGVPWGDLDVLFLGGSTEWKLSDHARRLTGEAQQRGKRVHMGRVNGWRRWQIADAWGCDTCDGTLLAFGPERHLPLVVSWGAQGGLW